MEATKIRYLERRITMPPEEPRNIGHRCGTCGNYFFRKVYSNPGTGGNY